MDGSTVQPSADVDETAVLGPGTAVWHLAQIREQARLGARCVVGRGAYVGPGVTIGDNVKIQNYALVYEPAQLGDGVFIGPAVVLTNDLYPRSTDVAGTAQYLERVLQLRVSSRDGDTAFLSTHALLIPAITLACALQVCVAATTMLALSSLSRSRRFVDPVMRRPPLARPRPRGESVDGSRGTKASSTLATVASATPTHRTLESSVRSSARTEKRAA